MPEDETVYTQEQAEEALRALRAPEGEPEDEPVAVAEPEPEPATDLPAEPEPEPSRGPITATEEGVDGGDDIESLRARLDDFQVQLKTSEERADARIAAIKERSAANAAILRDRYLRKSTAADRAKQVLLATRSEAGATEAEVNSAIQDLEGTQNPASATYAPPVTTTVNQEDRDLIINDFLNEKGMTQAEATEFDTWVRAEGVAQMSAAEQEIAEQSPAGFLRLLYSRYDNGVKEKRREAKTSDAVRAVEGVQRVQREAARAGATAPSVAGRRRAPKGEVDVKDLTEADVARLVRESVTQYQ